LSYNTDLLTFSQSKSSNVTSSDGKSFTINNPSPDVNGVLASVGFTVYLSKDSVTSIDMTNRTDTTAMPCGTLTLSQGGSATFDYNYICGERSISGFYNGQMLLRITSLRPNPSQDEIDIGLESAANSETVIEIFDVLGVKVHSEQRRFNTGKNTIHLDTKSLPSGAYIIRTGNTSQSFVKAK
ncbi:MAG: T9SS type A sorting domain-containing protein, partial [Ignavibacteriota bacterium]